MSAHVWSRYFFRDCCVLVQAALLSVERQQTIATLHACIVTHLASSADTTYGQPPSDALTSAAVQQRQATELQHSCFRLAAQLSEVAGGALAPRMDAVATGGIVSQLLARLSELTVGGGNLPGRHAAMHSGDKFAAERKHEGIDMAVPNVDELVLVVTPVAALRDRALALLARFEEQPMLLQLRTICDRLLGAHRFFAAHLPRKCMLALLDCFQTARASVGMLVAHAWVMRLRQPTSF